MNLYTILIEFEDRTVGIGQHEADSPESALINFTRVAESFEEYDRNAINSVIENRIKQGNLLIHIASDLKGFWNINFGLDLADVPELSSIFGGFIVQTDKNAPKRLE